MPDSIGIFSSFTRDIEYGFCLKVNTSYSCFLEPNLHTPQRFLEPYLHTPQRFLEPNASVAKHHLSIINT